MGNKGKRAIIYILVSFLAAIFGIWLISYAVKIHSKEEIQVSHNSGFYNEEISVKASTISGSKLFYSMSPDDEIMEYEGPICLSKNDDDNAYRIVFYTYDEDGEIIETVERYYLILDENRALTTDYLAMIWGDEDELFGYEDGILVTGKTFDDYMKENPDTDLYSGMIPANYYKDIERSVNLSLFNNKGEEILSQDCGMRVLGNFNRIKNQKSLKLTSRYIYDEKNEFTSVLFPELISESTGSPINDFHSLAIQNSGDDNGYGFIRNSLCNELAGNAGFRDSLSSKSVTLWINNQYRGVFWLQNYYDKRYFSEKYGEYDGVFSVNEGSLACMEIDGQKEIYEQDSAREYNELCEWIRTADVNDEKTWEKICDSIDIDDLIFYSAIEYYISNIDWINNNVKIYKYIPGENTPESGSDAFDGKYRYLLFDLDYGLGLKTFGFYGNGADSPFLCNLTDTDTDAFLFAKLFERDDIKELFARDVLQFINGAFNPEKAIPVLETKTASRQYELAHMLGNTSVMAGSLWVEDECSYEDVLSEEEEIKEFLYNRPAYVLNELNECMNSGTTGTIIIDCDGLDVLTDGLNVYEAVCVDNVPVTFTCDTCGIKIDGWMINDEYIAGDNVTILPVDYKNSEAKISVRPVWAESDESPLRIAKAYTNGSNDRVIIENKGLKTVNLSDYCVSDTEEKLMKAVLPDFDLLAGESIIIYGKRYELEHEPNSFQVDFSWNDEEKVYLSNKLDGLIDVR